METRLSKDFFERPVVKVARDLIGCILVRRNNSKTERYMITETEAYDGCDDLACHAAKGRTARTEILYGPAGVLYIYLVYGMHWMMNIVTGPRDYPAAVLIRGIEGAIGPGRVTKKLCITGMSNGKKLGQDSGIWIEQGEKIPASKIEKTARIGVDYAGPIWANKEFRFVLKTK